jgi:hypothetical protein
MLLRISLIIAILLGAGTIFVTQKLAREHLTEIRDARDKNAKDRDIATTRYKKAETNLASTSNKLNQTQATLAKTEEELNGTKQQLATVQEGLSKTKAELTKAVDDKKAAQAQLAKWESLGLQPEQIRDTIASLQKSKDAIAALEDEKAILSRRVIELTNKLMQIVGPEDYIVPLPAGTKGNVVAVDPKWNFVVLDIGSDKQMLEGGVLMVHRNSQLVGKVRIREVLPHRSIASPLPGWRLGDVEEGDQVLY